MRHRICSLSCSLVIACLASGASSAGAGAAPKVTPQAASSKAKPIAVKRSKAKRQITKWETSNPSHAERLRAAGEELTLAAMPWATVTVRAPFASTRTEGSYAAYAGDRAALTFVDPEFADARSGWAGWKSRGGIGLPGGFPGGAPTTDDQIDAITCALLGIGCGGDGDSPPDVDLHVWVNAKAGKDYVAVCRVKFEDNAGELDIGGDGAATMSVQVDHTGRPYGTTSFVIDATSAGWYGVALASDEAWSTTGCTIDEV